MQPDDNISETTQCSKVTLLSATTADSESDFGFCSDSKTTCLVIQNYSELLKCDTTDKIEDEVKSERKPCLKQYLCFGILLMSIFQIVFFKKSTKGNAWWIFNSNNLLFSSSFGLQFWRYLSYSLIHDSATHVASNVMLQLLLAIPLEYSSSTWRVMAIYLTGVLFGSLGQSVISPQNDLIGASAGVYALLLAYVPTICLDWSSLKIRSFHLATFAGTFVFLVHSSMSNQANVSDIAHFSGSLAGVLVGTCLVKNSDNDVTKLKIIAGICICATMIFGILFVAIRWQSDLLWASKKTYDLRLTQMLSLRFQKYFAIKTWAMKEFHHFVISGVLVRQWISS